MLEDDVVTKEDIDNILERIDELKMSPDRISEMISTKLAKQLAKNTQVNKNFISQEDLNKLGALVEKFASEQYWDELAEKIAENLKRRFAEGEKESEVPKPIVISGQPEEQKTPAKRSGLFGISYDTEPDAEPLKEAIEDYVEPKLKGIFGISMD